MTEIKFIETCFFMNCKLCPEQFSDSDPLTIYIITFYNQLYSFTAQFVNFLLCPVKLNFCNVQIKTYLKIDKQI